MLSRPTANIGPCKHRSTVRFIVHGDEARRCASLVRPIVNDHSFKTVQILNFIETNGKAVLEMTDDLADHFSDRERVPMLGTMSADTAAPDTDMSMTKHSNMRPSERIKVERGSCGMMRLC